jgi:hypothetical protein
MPPKKAPAPEKKILLGRPSNNLKIGIVGVSSPFAFLTLHSSRFVQGYLMLANRPSLMLSPRRVT